MGLSLSEFQIGRLGLQKWTSSTLVIFGLHFRDGSYAAPVQQVTPFFGLRLFKDARWCAYGKMPCRPLYGRSAWISKASQTGGLFRKRRLSLVREKKTRWWRWNIWNISSVSHLFRLGPSTNHGELLVITKWDHWDHIFGNRIWDLPQPQHFW